MHVFSWADEKNDSKLFIETFIKKLLIEISTNDYKLSMLQYILKLIII